MKERLELTSHCTCNKKGCKPCKSRYNREHYLNNKQVYIDKAKTNTKTYKDRNREFVYQFLLKNPCVDCGETNPIKLEFDHIKNKDYNVSNMTRKAFSIKKLRDEISKCEVRCASCHREKTAKQLGHWIYKKHYGLLV